MSLRDELHQIVDQIGEDSASQLLDFARDLADETQPHNDSAMSRLSRRMEPGASGCEFFSGQRRHRDLKTMAAEQGVRPVERFEDLLGDFWPEDEQGEDFDAWLREIRRDGVDERRLRRRYRRHFVSL